MKTLICCPGDSPIISPKGCDQTYSPIQCLEKAFSCDYELIFIQFTTQTIKQRYELVELCAVLKQHQRTKQIPIMALLPSWQRALIEKLNNISIDYAKIINGQINTIFSQKLSDDDLVSHILNKLCPYLEYQPIDPSREIVLCKAYYSRLVLSRNRLCQICHQTDFKTCPFFKAPKFAQKGNEWKS